MRLSNFGYTETKNTNQRRNSLLTAARRYKPERIIKALQSRKYRKAGYKEKRLRADINFLKRRTIRRGSLFI